jgi:hypothetical protein
MEPKQPRAESRTRPGRRLVLIRGEEPRQEAPSPQPPLRIIGSEPRPSGGFRLTDR